MDKKTTIIFGVLIVGLIGLVMWARANSEPSTSTENSRFNWPGTEIACLILGHQGLASHVHPNLNITIDGVAETIPANIGVTNECMSEVHTHDGSGQLHVESVVHGRTFGIDSFFAVWGRSIERDGYTYVLRVNGSEVDPATYVFADGDVVEVAYSSGTGETVDVETATITVGSTTQEVEITTPAEGAVDFGIEI